ncbi:hypothetical protein IFM89_004036 [Coptis chinensis]|uniref:Uncharacterized protein n=1 Tax=Coptis chinensis TaxID=261450 RepID=A0A835GYL3_9MAGN|nr:hypothetical protein IFM89_004036 [Coptis chinensis]
MSEKTEKEIEIRSLSGESVIISISPNLKIQEIKLLLKLIFTPAKNSPNFHLFFKGAKMRMESIISSYTIEKEEFIVLVPFTKKNIQSQTHSKPYDQLVKRTPSSNCTDSTWDDLMQDLSSFVERNRNNKGLYEIPKKDESRNGLVGDVINGGKSGIVLDEKGYEKVVKVMDRVNCLCDAKSLECLISKLLGFSYGKSCHCPVWLKKLLKVFSFLNIFSGFLQMQSVDVTCDRLNGAMKKLGVFGLDLCIEDVKQLSVLCPKIVRIGTYENVPIKLGDAIVIVDSSKDVGGQSDSVNNVRTVRKQISTSTIVNAIKKREAGFKEHLWWAVRDSMAKRKSGNRMNLLPSLEDLIVSIKYGNSATTCGEAKRARTGSTAVSNSLSGQKRCHVNVVIIFNLFGEQDMKPLLPAEMVEHLRKGIGSREQIVHIEEICGRKAVYVDIPNALSETTRSALKRIGVSRLYSHQAESIQASLSGKNVVVATMTSSGKSLCYNVPVLESLSQNLTSCALYLFPTKALAQDQMRALSLMTEGMKMSCAMGVYDGDTSQGDRMWLRDNARLLITNPDMLHMSILPSHTQFQRILSNLRFVVIDETHTYKGAFGCHTALILRRLRRLCAHVYGSDPSFIFCTATSANPREHAMELAGLPTLDLIQNDGSPSGPKLFVLWNPPLIWKTVSKFSSDTGISKTADKNVISRRTSPVSEISSIFAEMVQHGLRCIAFCKTRKLCELVLFYTREILQETAPCLVDSICSYRGGYVAQDRRRIESEFFGGKLRGVAATNALELGIDVGYIDATLHLGFPGSISSLWQQAGRSGRRERPSLAVYVAFEGPLDQYFMTFPEKLFRRSIECCHVDAKNKQVLEQHLVCAAVEHPLSFLHDDKYFGPSLHCSITALTKKGYLSSDPSRDSPVRIWSYIGHEKRPSYGISIRAIETEKYKVIDKKTDEVIEEIEESKAFFQVYEGAVYMQQGKIYLVKDLDIFEKIALCEEDNPKYFTKTRDYTDVHVPGGDIPAYAMRAEAHFNPGGGVQTEGIHLSSNACSLCLTYLRYPYHSSDDNYRETAEKAVCKDYWADKCRWHPLIKEKAYTATQDSTAAQTNFCKVTTTWFGFFKIQRGSNEILDSVPLSLPNYSYESQAVWIRVPPSIKDAVENRKLSFPAGLHAVAHALCNVVPLFIQCNSSDLASECVNPNEIHYLSEGEIKYRRQKVPERILLYDQHPGGSGVSAQMQPRFREILVASLELITTCRCSVETGCPSCVQSFSCHEYNEVLHKNAAIIILKVFDYFAQVEKVSSKWASLTQEGAICIEDD